MIQLLFGEVRVSEYADEPVLILREASGRRQLPVWISAAAASAILGALETDDLEHPATHDLFVETLSTLDAVIESVRITAERDGVFDADLVVNGMTIACRLSDGIALALRCGAPILVREEIMDALALGEAIGEDTVEEFRAFLDQVRADDFDESDPA